MCRSPLIEKTAEEMLQPRISNQSGAPENSQCAYCLDECAAISRTLSHMGTYFWTLTLCRYLVEASTQRDAVRLARWHFHAICVVGHG